MRNLVFVAAFSASFPMIAAGQQDTETAVGRIRAEYAAVQNALEGFEHAEKPYFYGDGEGLVTTYSEGGEIRKIVVRFDRDGYSSLSEYFFADGALFFAFVKGETFQIWPDQDPSEFGVTENRYYFANERLIRWLTKSHTENMRQREVPPDNEDYAAEGGTVVADGHSWAEYAESDIEDYEAFLDSRRDR